jgi:hypothetical protein
VEPVVVAVVAGVDGSLCWEVAKSREVFLFELEDDEEEPFWTTDLQIQKS